MTFKYYLWHENQVKTLDRFEEVLSHRGAYVMSNALGGSSFGFVLPSAQWICISPGDVPKAFKLGLMLLEIYL